MSELAASETQLTLSGYGRVMVGGRPVLRAASDGSIRLWSSGQPIGQIRGPSIFALDAAGTANVEIGIMDSGLVQLVDEVPLRIIQVRPNWYRLAPGAQSTLPTVELAIFAAVAEEERKKLERSGQPFPVLLDDLLSQTDIGISDGEYMRALVYAARAVQLHPSSERAREMLAKVHRIRSILK